jgi:hypothetical protein
MKHRHWPFGLLGLVGRGLGIAAEPAGLRRGGVLLPETGRFAPRVLPSAIFSSRFEQPASRARFALEQHARILPFKFDRNLKI